MSVRGIARRATAIGYATPTNAPIYLDSDDNILKIIPAGSGTTEVQVVDASSAQTLTTKTFVAPALGAATATSLQASSFIKSSSPAATGGVGYSTGAGGAVTQITNRSTGVTMVPNPCMSGAITTDTSSLAAEVSADFIVTNSAVAIGDVVVVSVRSGSNGASTHVSVITVTTGTFTIRVSNQNAAGGAAETGAIIINFAVIKAVSA